VTGKHMQLIKTLNMSLWRPNWRLCAQQLLCKWPNHAP